MSAELFSSPKKLVPKSILIEQCKKAIEDENRGESLDILLALCSICRSGSEKELLDELKSRHREKFQKKPDDWVGEPRRICGINHTISGPENLIHGGKRVLDKNTNCDVRPKISIVTVNRNCADGLEKTIKSVINQRNEDYQIEHIVIDGLSTDHSIDILRKYEGDIDYFISEPDSGIYSAMNKGLSLAQGDIISFLNSDDIYLNNAAKMSAANIIDNHLDISYAGFAYIKPNGYVEMVDGPREWDEAMLIRGIPGGHGTFFATKETYNKVGAYREDFRIVSDYEWMLRAYLAGCIARPIYRIIHEMTQGGISFSGSIEKDENSKLLTDYLGESSSKRIEQLYSMKYYLNWQDQMMPQENLIQFLNASESLKHFEPLYSRALLKTVNRSIEKRNPDISSHRKNNDANHLKICIAVTYLNSIAGGAERIAIEAANRLAREGHSVTIVSCHGLSGEPFYIIDENVEYIDLANKPLSNEFIHIGSKGWESLQGEINRMGNGDSEDINEWLVEGNKWKTLIYKGFFKSNSFDIVVSHMPSTYPYVALALAGEPFPPLHVACLHNSPEYKFKSDIYLSNSAREKRVWQSTLRLCDHVSVLFEEFKQELPSGITEKSFVLPNFIGSNFFAGESPVATNNDCFRIVTVGRLAPQKNHKSLIDAFVLTRNKNPNCMLEIYGEGPLKSELEAYCLKKGLNPTAVLRGRTEIPEHVYRNADLFVFPSHFEGFGLALVEAMACGLPVIGFEDCPGVRFIIKNGIDGLLVKRDENSESLSNAIIELINDRELRRHLGENARKSAAEYTIDKHIHQLNLVINNDRKPISYPNIIKRRASDGFDVAIMCTHAAGGAGVAASRLHKGFNKIKISSVMFSSTKGVLQRSFELKAVGSDAKLNPENWRISNKNNLKNTGATIFSSELGTLRNSELKAPAAYDIINLHWVSHFLSPSGVSNFLSLGKPVVWTLHDMLPFTGGCHYTSGCDKFTRSCENCPQVVNNYGNHPQRVLETKKKLWENLITVITPSKWLAEEARKSAIFCNSRIEVVPNGIDTTEYQPWDKYLARKILGLPQHKKIILFACHSHTERRKGFTEALMMLSLLRQRRDDIHLVTLGKPNDITNDLSLENTMFGYIESEEKLSMIYSACDATILPSLEDNLPNIILESFSCGTPVAAFRSGGIKDLIEDGITGYLAPVKDIFALCDAVEKCVDSDLRENCRSYAVKNLDCSRQAQGYADIFRSLFY